MGQTKIICIGCPKGCPITVTYEDKTITNIEGFGCKNSWFCTKKDVDGMCKGELQNYSKSAS